jgi:hypothetical protein
VGQAVTGTLTERWDGSTWTQIPSPNGAGVTNQLRGAVAVTDNDVWAVGFTCPTVDCPSAQSLPQSLIERWNGTQWNLVPGPGGTSALFGVDAAAANDVWAVGARYNGVLVQTLITRWNGTSWNTVSSPNVGFFPNILFGVSVVAPNDVWAVGAACGDLTCTTAQTLTLHWNGSAWSIVPSPNPGAFRNGLAGVDGQAANNVWAVGQACADSTCSVVQGLVMRWNGSAWSIMPSPNPGAINTHYNAVAAVSATEAWAVGSYSSDGVTLQNATIWWNGSAWYLIAAPNPGTVVNELWALAARSPYDIWAVGAADGGSGLLPQILHWAPGVCPATPTPLPGSPTATPPSGSGTPTVTATPCSTANYVYTPTAGATIVPGATDIGNHCDDCETAVTLPFPYTLYDQTFTTVQVNANGRLRFGQATVFPVVCLPFPGYTYNVLPYATDLRTDTPNSGVYTSVTGVAPNRIFNIEWRATVFASGQPVNFEVRLYEGQQQFEFIYATVDSGGAVVGVQRDNTRYTEYTCGPGLTAGLKLMFTLPSCETATPSPTATPGGPTATRTSTAVGLSPTVVPTPCPIQFTDVDPNNPFYPFIRCLACRQIVSGYSDGTFRWGADVTRGQLAKIIASSAGLGNNIPSTQQTFSDVPNTNPFWLFIERLAETGAISGYTCGGPGEPCDPQQRPYFRWGNPATRGQISKITGVTAGYNGPIPTTRQTFADVPPTNAFWLWIEELAARQIISGYGCGGPGEPCDPQNRPYFRWGANATRGQMSKIAAQSFLPNCSTPGRVTGGR